MVYSDLSEVLQSFASALNELAACKLDEELRSHLEEMVKIYRRAQESEAQMAQADIFGLMNKGGFCESYHSCSQAQSQIPSG